jgi:primosomal protein N' (replication factor Y)
VRAWRLDRSFSYAVPDALSSTLAVGSLVRIPLGARKVRGIVVEIADDNVEGLEPVLSVVVRTPLAVPALRDLLRWVATRYVAPQPAAFERVVPPRVRVEVRPVVPLANGPAPELLSAYPGGAELHETIASGSEGVWCLRTRSGDDRGRLITELVAAAGRATGAAFVMVPEVHYGSRVLDKLQEAFPDCVRLDSSRSDGERAAGWLGMAAGHGLGGGGRGSVFVPCPDLRLIVVDEEHHRTYKEDRAPRFDARKVAMERSRRQGAVCVLISIAPLLETGAGVRAGDLRLVEPTREADRAARPIVELMDKPDDRQLAHSFHQRIHDCLHTGGKVAVLVPMRGYARALWCGACRRSVRCPVCEAGVRLEAGGMMIRCPRCGFSAGTPDACPICGARDFRLVGAGSERLAGQLGAMFPKATVTRVDADTLVDAEPRPTAADIYVTTWIGTKPALRPDVSLVAVLDADALIRMPDFRAAENAYRALVEMAEWAGPAAEGGRLLVQTAQPSHHAIQALARADYGFFLERELQQRRDLGYPPFAELVKLRCSGLRYVEVLDEVAELCRGLGAQVLGPIRLRAGAGSDVDAAEVLVKHPDAEQIAECLRGILPKIPTGTRLRVDVDPR